MTPKEQTNGDADHIEYVSLSQETRRRYLNYAMSVISSRALPDVRDGMKPVQRRILYVMHQELGLTFDSKTRKCAKITGDTTGNYHPHGPLAVYEALVRMAQDFTLRYPLVHGQGNFGSVIGLGQAAERYTEAKLSALAEELMNELRYQTVDTRPNYDATRHEPVVLPARFPNLLVNGSQGIAVGMATSIPPHNLTEVIKGCVYLISNPDATVAQVMKHIKGPDFPLGGRIVTDRTTLRKAYEEGKGSVKLRGEWKFDRDRKGEISNRIIIYSVPYGVETGPLLTTIGELVNSRKLPQLLTALDETDDKNGLRVVLEIKPGADPEAVMAFLFKHTPLEQNIPMNLTCLIPGEHGEVLPARLSLVEMLQQFLRFRFETVRRRFEYQLQVLRKRIHILEGFAIVFDGLDKALKIIRASDGRKDACEKMMKIFPLDEDQTFAILDMALYKISQLEIDRIMEELEEKRAEAKRIEAILASDKKLWNVVQSELEELTDKFGDKRRTSVGSADEIAEYDPEAYIVRENTNVVITTDGWIKRVGRLASVETTRVREGDKVLDVVPGSTLDHVVFFSSEGVAYTMRMDHVPPSSGYGDPISKYFRMGDGASIIAAMTTDPRFTPEDQATKKQPVPAPYLLVATARGQVMRISFSPFRVASTKIGRKYCRLSAGDKVVGVEMIADATSVFLASHHARILHCSLDDIPILSGVGKGVRGIKLAPDDELLGLTQMTRPSDCLRARTSGDKTLTFGQQKYGITSRGGKGIKTSHRSTFEELIRPEIEIIDWAAIEGE